LLQLLPLLLQLNPTERPTAAAIIASAGQHQHYLVCTLAQEYATQHEAVQANGCE
jgi:hypothetical protein